ncbi:molybdopterin oxidoreductase family protein [Rubinisphaera margarita]|uniref:molybdopterin oxidoreductase family protein n=1 Tax=Rubinisphaera margarita TaxID=2909586 RepID=UPI001EE915B4|nr:nitrate reductase [Rubinisphaera margarita]MCG6155169.1 nitrate reductase [Rubinisphaera margarita]
MSSALTKPVSLVRDLIHQKSGPLTRELIQQPGGFGLGNIPASARPDRTTMMVCGFCSTGCGLNIHLKDRQAIGLTPAKNSPVNLGMACPKGWEALEVLKAKDRATMPLTRCAGSGELRRTEWHIALNEFCDRFKSIQQEHGNDSVAFISTGQIVNEEMAFLGALAKFGMGMIHGDGNTRQCMATAATAYKQSFGFDAPPFTYQDFEESDVLVFVGANPCIAHPIMWERVMRNQNNPEIVVIDPRKTETAMQSTQHLALAPKSDLTLFYGLARLLIDKGWIDREFIDAHTTEFDAFAEHVAPFTLERVCSETGISPDAILHLAHTIHEGKKVSFWWTMGVNQSYEGTRLAQSLINLSLMTGNIGRPGTGANSITGQCNAMGSRMFSNTTGLFAGRNFENEQDRKDVAEILGINVESIPQQNSLAYNEIIDGIESGKIRGLWVIATNPAHSWINQNRLKELREKLDFLVVQDMYSTTETAQIADLVLPAAAWGEKEGTFINSERRIGLVKKVSAAPGQALSDFFIFRLIAEYWGCGEMFENWGSPADVFEILKKLTAGRPNDITGITDYHMIDEAGGIQWPLKAGEELKDSQRRLFEDGQFYHADGKAKFYFEEPREMPEPPDDDYPFTLLTGRGSASQWHTQTRTSKSAVLRKLYPKTIFAEIHPDDASRLGIRPEDWVEVASRRAAIEVKALVTVAVQPGQIFIPMHYKLTNQLTHDSFDPYSKQPSYKACAVTIRQTRGGSR